MGGTHTLNSHVLLSPSNKALSPESTIHCCTTGLSTNLSWDGQSPILWQQWRREGVGWGGLEGREDRSIIL